MNTHNKNFLYEYSLAGMHSLELHLNKIQSSLLFTAQYC